MIRKVSVAFVGGVVGALLALVCLWFFGKIGIIHLLQVNIKPFYTMTGFLKGMLWGGIWMLPLAIPLWRDRAILRGCFFSLLPSAVILFLILPEMGKGMMGLRFGSLMPVIVVGINFVYGITAAVLFKAVTKLRL
ncbi:MAG: hypothetical protein PHN75_05930 [Syntrophales bacterium]|nr:hypothetical protein [Syntrophales bacterium]